MDNTSYLKGVKFVDFVETEINFNQLPFNLSAVKYIEKFIFDTPVTILQTLKYIVRRDILQIYSYKFCVFFIWRELFVY